MNDVKIDFKTLITVGGIIAVLGGFYFTTQLRLDSLEAEIQTLSEDIGSLETSVQETTKQTKRLNKRVNQLERKDE